MRREEIPYPPPTVDILDGSDGKESACNAGDLGWEDPLGKRIATHSSILSYYIVLGIRAWYLLGAIILPSTEVLHYPFQD